MVRTAPHSIDLGEITDKIRKAERHFAPLSLMISVQGASPEFYQIKTYHSCGIKNPSCLLAKLLRKALKKDHICIFQDWGNHHATLFHYILFTTGVQEQP